MCKSTCVELLVCTYRTNRICFPLSRMEGTSPPDTQAAVIGATEACMCHKGKVSREWCRCRLVFGLSGWHILGQSWSLCVSVWRLKILQNLMVVLKAAVIRTGCLESINSVGKAEVRKILVLLVKMQLKLGGSIKIQSLFLQNSHMSDLYRLVSPDLKQNRNVTLTERRSVSAGFQPLSGVWCVSCRQRSTYRWSGCRSSVTLWLAASLLEALNLTDFSRDNTNTQHEEQESCGTEHHRIRTGNRSPSGSLNKMSFKTKLLKTGRRPNKSLMVVEQCWPILLSSITFVCAELLRNVWKVWSLKSDQLPAPDKLLWVF